MSAVLEIPRHLPVKHLSVTSIGTYLKCPERWRRRYLENEYEPSSGKMLAGKAVGAAEAAHYQTQIDTGTGLALSDVLDAFTDEWQLAADTTEVDWGEDKPTEIKDSARVALERYHLDVAPEIQPTSVERPFTLRFPDTDWTVTGYLDLEEADDVVSDLKVKGKSISQADADSDMQPTTYMLARRTEGRPASEFHFHLLNRGVKAPYAKVIPTQRTDAQLDAHLRRIVGVAAEIAWRAENEHWQGAVPGSWWCSQKMCGFWESCPMGGAR